MTEQREFGGVWYVGGEPMTRAFARADVDEYLDGRGDDATGEQRAAIVEHMAGMEMPSVMHAVAKVLARCCHCAPCCDVRDRGGLA